VGLAPPFFCTAKPQSLVVLARRTREEERKVSRKERKRTKDRGSRRGVPRFLPLFALCAFLSAIVISVAGRRGPILIRARAPGVYRLGASSVRRAAHTSRAVSAVPSERLARVSSRRPQRDKLPARPPRTCLPSGWQHQARCGDGLPRFRASLHPSVRWVGAPARLPLTMNSPSQPLRSPPDADNMVV